MNNNFKHFGVLLVDTLSINYRLADKMFEQFFFTYFFPHIFYLIGYGLLLFVSGILINGIQRASEVKHHYSTVCSTGNSRGVMLEVKHLH